MTGGSYYSINVYLREHVDFKIIMRVKEGKGEKSNRKKE